MTLELHPPGMPAMTKLYHELAAWWPLLSAPADYAEAAAFYHQVITAGRVPPPHTLVEFGSGGGNTASHLKRHFELTLVDLSPEMLAVSRALNPDCAHVAGDMRYVRLGRQFDAVLIHDAIVYMTTVLDLRSALATAFAHCRPGGVALFAPDYVRETFAPATAHGGEDGPQRSLRYLEWTYDPDPNDTAYTVDFAYLLREPDGSTRAVHDRHTCGVFTRAEWLRLLAEVGFQPQALDAPGGVEVFVGAKPGD